MFCPCHEWSLLCIVAVSSAMLVIGMGKAGFGAGVGIVAMPIMALAVSAREALALLLPALLLGDIIGIAGHKKVFAGKLLRWLVPGAIGGIIVAAVVLHLLLQQGAETIGNVLNVLVGSVCLAVIGSQAWRLLGRPVPKLPASPGLSAGIGFVEGFISTLTHSAGALVTVYLLKQNLGKVKFVTTMLLLFFFINGAKLIAFVADGFVTWSTLRRMLLFLPLVPLGAVLGFWMNKRVSSRPFTIVLYVIASIAAVKMIVKVVG